MTRPVRWSMLRGALCATLAAGLAARPASAQAVSDGGAPSWAAADAHADAAPAAATTNVASLAAYLAGAGDDELTRARALFRWLVRNIDYDVAGYLGRRPMVIDPQAVLEQRRAVCDGYARLSEALGTAMGLRVVVIRGWSKGYGYTPGQAFLGETNHAWNAIQIRGRWRLWDATWGAGGLDERMQFMRRQQDHYFLTAPQDFIYDHLPEDPQWQLLERPVTGMQYATLAYLRPGFFRTGLTVRSHPSTDIAASGRVRVTFGLGAPVVVWATVTDTAGRPVPGNWALWQVEDTELAVHASFPAAGAYLLRIFAKPRSAEGQTEWAVDYSVVAGAGDAAAELATVYEALRAVDGRLDEPLDGVLRSGRSYRFRLRVPGAQDVAVVAGGTWTHLTRVGDEFTGEVRAVPGDLHVYAKFTEGPRYEALIRYVGR